MSISSHAPPGTELGTVIATDRDVGRFGQIAYHMQPGDMSSLFALDEQTGKRQLIYHYTANILLVHIERSFFLLYICVELTFQA